MFLYDFINQGGSIMWVLVGLNIIGISLIAWRAWALVQFKKDLGSRSSEIMKEITQAMPSHEGRTEVARDFVSVKVSELEYGMTMIRIIATIAPLLGLLGTVVGIFDAFTVISQKGLSNPSDFAEGISLALITTIGGLIVAIPHYIAHNLITSQLDQLELKLERMILPELLVKK
jgi:biopolymer transport protein ExbB